MIRLEVVKIVPVKKSEYWDVQTWKLRKTNFDDHITRWKMRMLSTPTDWLRDRCKEIGVEYADMVGHSRKRAVTVPRQRLMYEVYEKFPDLSLPQIGRMFGGRDHSTLIHGIRAHKERMNAND